MKTSTIGKIAYGAAFVVLLPLLLLWWARATNDSIALPIVPDRMVGILASACGAVMMFAGMATLMLRGNGLPMNAYPPSQYVQSGIYKYFSHPIYTGFCGVAIGLSIIFQSPSGLWLVSPILMLGCAALVYGFERQDLQERFGDVVSPPIISLPPALDRPATLSERISVYVLVFLPWVILYEAVLVLGTPSGAFELSLPSERTFPVIEWTELLYASTYVFVFLVPLLPSSSRRLRTFAVNGLIATALVIFCFIILPFTAQPRPFVPSGYLGTLLEFERAHDGPVAAFPSFHVVWSLLAAAAFCRSLPRGRYLWYMWSAAIIVSCFTTGMHTLADIAGGLASGYAVLRMPAIWETIRTLTERLANSWKEWRIGPVRIINHGAYVAFGSFGGLCIVGSIVGSGAVTSMVIVAFFSLVGAGLWAQFVEGSPSLLRPFGYYGGALGCMLGCVVAYVLGTDLWLFLAAFAIAGPWIQAAGRLRCLVQGCCHGRTSSPAVGIRYTHPRSRVCRLSALANIPVHPTPLYSILWNIATGIVLMRLYLAAAPLPLIAGLYLIFNGLGRFVEESFRGEPQTASFGKLRLYQWLSIASVGMGIVFTTVQHEALPIPMHFDVYIFFASFMFGAVVWCAMGVDVPQSNKRFSRLV